MAILGTQLVLHSLAVVVGVSIVKLIVLYLQFTHSLIHETYLLGDRTPPPTRLGNESDNITNFRESPGCVGTIIKGEGSQLPAYERTD